MIGLAIQIAVLLLAIYWISIDLEDRMHVDKKDFYLWVIFLVMGSVGWGVLGLTVVFFLYLFWSRLFH